MGWLLVVVLALLGCRSETATVRNGDARPLFLVVVREPGASARDMSTGAALPMALALGRHGELEVTASAARKGEAAVLVQADERDAVESTLDEIDAVLPERTPRPVVEVWDVPSDARIGRIVVTVEQVALERTATTWNELVTALSSATDTATPDALRGLSVGNATLGELGTIEARPPTSDQVVVRLEATTHDVLRRDMDELSAALTGALDVTVEQAPPIEATLEVRMRPEVMLAQKVHFPEIQTAIARFGRRRHRLDARGDGPPIELVVEPAPMEEAGATEIESKWGNQATLATMADVQVVEHPTSLLRGSQGQFVGFLLVRGAPTSVVTVTVSTRGREAVEGLDAEVLGRRATLSAPTRALLSWASPPATE